MTEIETIAAAALSAPRSSRRANLVIDITELPARTLNKCKAKAGVLRAILGGECGPGSIEDLADSLARDVLALGN